MVGQKFVISPNANPKFALLEQWKEHQTRLVVVAFRTGGAVDVCSPSGARFNNLLLSMLKPVDDMPPSCKYKTVDRDGQVRFHQEHPVWKGQQWTSNSETSTGAVFTTSQAEQMVYRRQQVTLADLDDKIAQRVALWGDDLVWLMGARGNHAFDVMHQNKLRTVANTKLVVLSRQDLFARAWTTIEQLPDGTRFRLGTGPLREYPVLVKINGDRAVPIEDSDCKIMTMPPGCRALNIELLEKWGVKDVLS